MNVLPGLVLTALGVGCVFPTASVAITSGVEQHDQGLAGGLFTTCQQVGAATGLAILATVAAARTVHADGSLAAGYRLSFMIATGIALAAAAIVARQLNAATRQPELARQEQPAPEALPPTNPARDLMGAIGTLRSRTKQPSVRSATSIDPPKESDLDRSRGAVLVGAGGVASAARSGWIDGRGSDSTSACRPLHAATQGPLG